MAETITIHQNYSPGFKITLVNALVLSFLPGFTLNHRRGKSELHGASGLLISVFDIVVGEPSTIETPWQPNWGGLIAQSGITSRLLKLPLLLPLAAWRHTW